MPVEDLDVGRPHVARRFREVAEAMPVGLVVLQHDGEGDARSLRIEVVNAAAAALFTRGDLAASVGRTIADAMVDAVLADVPAIALETIRTAEIHEVGAVVNGAGRMLHITVFPLAGEAAGVVLDDVTAEHQRERLLERLALAEEEERHRIAVGVHDEPVQRLAAAALRIQALRAAAVVAPDVDSRLAEVDSLVRDALVSLRRLIFELRPPELDEEGLVAAIELAAEQILSATSTAFALEASLHTEPPAAVQATVYRVMVEALVNARTHAQASEVRATIVSDGDELRAEVVDDGVGITRHAESQPGHLGLRTMRERAEAAGGSLVVEPASPHGTRVRLIIPQAF
ncbi:MAG TPA: histidine kinase [Acidimicrobiales bacterium]|jgi:signal transduction histidine kinase|nr:histidine kinase [Acidimicrobiales bacterium]